MWMRTIQDKSKKKEKKEIKMIELKNGGEGKKRRRKNRIGLGKFRNLKLLFTK